MIDTKSITTPVVAPDLTEIKATTLRNRELAEEIAYRVFEEKDIDLLSSPEVLADFIFQILQRKRNDKQNFG